MGPLNERLAELSALSQKLNAASEELNETIEHLEDQLQRDAPGVSVWLESQLLDATGWRGDDDRELNVLRGWQLGYCKLDSVWRIAVRRVVVERAPVEEALAGDTSIREGDTVVEQTRSPLLEAPRIVRVEAAAVLEQLVEEIANRVRTVLEGIERAKRLTST